MKKWLSHLQTMTHMQPAVENVATGMPLLVNADAERKFVALGAVSRVGFRGGEGLRHYTSAKHEAWMGACSSPSTIDALVTLMLSDCPSQLAKLRWSTLAKKSASSPNHPIRCALCTKTIWSYCMAQHHADVHDTARHPHLMQIADAEQEAVLNWVPHKAKKKDKAMHLRGLMMPHLRHQPHVHPATLLRRLQACLPCLPLSLSVLRPPCQVSPRQRPLGLSDLVL